MKFTSEDLMKAMGLSVGDRVKINDNIYEISYKCINLLDDENETINTMPTFYLLNVDFEILSKPKRVGDTLCKDCECVECHLRCLPHCNQSDSAKKTLFNILDGWNEYNSFDQEIHDLLKTRLDKEVLGNET